jgi:hypothetical protein
MIDPEFYEQNEMNTDYYQNMLNTRITDIQ